MSELEAPEPSAHADNDNGFEKVDAMLNPVEDVDVQKKQRSAGEAASKIDPTEGINNLKQPENLDSQSSTIGEGLTRQAQSSSPGDGWLKKIDPRVLDIIYWRDIKKTSIIFGSMLLLMLSVALFSILSVVAYLSLATLTVTLSFRIYKNVMGAVQKTGEGHPFKKYLDYDIKLPEDKIKEAASIVMHHATSTIHQLRRLFLVEDIFDTLKFGLLLWTLTYIGSWFNGMTLIILALIATFTVPKVYETYQKEIDDALGKVNGRVRTVFEQLKEKIPLLNKQKAA